MRLKMRVNSKALAEAILSMGYSQREARIRLRMTEKQFARLVHGGDPPIKAITLKRLREVFPNAGELAYISEG